MITFNKHGFINGGLCQRRLEARKARSEGSRMAWDDIVDNKKYVVCKKGWYQIIKEPSGRGAGKYGGGDIEIGYLRMLQDVFSRLASQKKKFRLKHMNNWIEGIASAEFGMSGGLHPPKGNDDAYYEKIHGVKRGLLTIK